MQWQDLLNYTIPTSSVGMAVLAHQAFGNARVNPMGGGAGCRWRGLEQNLSQIRKQEWLRSNKLGTYYSFGDSQDIISFHCFIVT